MTSKDLLESDLSTIITIIVSYFQVLSLIYFLVVVCVPDIGKFTSTYNWGAMVSSVSFLVSGGFLVRFKNLHIIVVIVHKIMQCLGKQHMITFYRS